MRGLLLVVLLAAGCSRLTQSPPTKIHGTTADVFWVYSAGQILRCWQHKVGAPVCMPAVVLRNPIESGSNHPELTDTPIQAPPAEPMPPSAGQ